MWDFETDPEYQQLLDWADAFVRDEVEPLDLIWPHLQFTPPLNETRRKVVDPLKEQVRQKKGGLWATHLGPDLGGQGGYGQLKLALLNEILGRSQWAPIIFGCQAPRHGQCRDHRSLRHAGAEGTVSASAARGRTVLQLLDDRTAGRLRPPHPVHHRCRSRRGRLGDQRLEVLLLQRQHRVIPHRHGGDQPPRRQPPIKACRCSCCRRTPPPVNIVRNVGLYGEREGEGSHALIHYDNVRVPDSALLGGEGQAFVIAQTRLGGGRIHHAMRTIGLAQKAIDMMCERALSRETAGSRLADKQAVQEYIADSYAQLKQFRLMVLHTAWEIDKYNDYKKVRKDIAAVKVVMPTVLHDIAWRAMQVHGGALGVTNEMPFLGMVTGAAVMGLADGPTEVHKTTVAKQVLRGYRASDDIWPSEWLPRKRDAARERFAEYLDLEVGGNS